MKIIERIYEWWNRRALSEELEGAARALKDAHEQLVDRNHVLLEMRKRVSYLEGKLAGKREATVGWCPSCGRAGTYTALADMQASIMQGEETAALLCGKPVDLTVPCVVQGRRGQVVISVIDPGTNGTKS